jgi:hypothetical protein
MTAVGFPMDNEKDASPVQVASSEPKTLITLMRTNEEQFIIDRECQKNDHERVMNRWRVAFFVVVIYVVADVFSKVHCTCPPEARAVMKITPAIKAIPFIKATQAIKAAAPTIHARPPMQWVSLDLRLYFPIKPQYAKTSADLDYLELRTVKVHHPRLRTDPSSI